MDKEMLQTVTKTLGISEEEAAANVKPLPELEAYLFWKPVRGGGAVIIKSNGEKLSAGSSVSPQALERAFRDGRRN